MTLDAELAIKEGFIVTETSKGTGRFGLGGDCREDVGGVAEAVRGDGSDVGGLPRLLIFEIMGLHCDNKEYGERKECDERREGRRCWNFVQHST